MKTNKPIKEKTHEALKIRKEGHRDLSEYCDERGLKKQAFFDRLDTELIKVYALLDRMRKNGKIINLNEGLLQSFISINEYIQLTALDCLLYEQFEDDTNLSKKTGDKTFQLLLTLARIGLKTEEGKAQLILMGGGDDDN